MCGPRHIIHHILCIFIIMIKMVNTKGMTIVLTGGGTAGHVLPHIALLPHLRKQFKKIYYIGGTNPAERQIIEREGIEFFPLECVKLRRGLNLKNLARNLMIPVGFVKSVKTAGRILDELKPDIIFSKGGFVALPVVKAASSRNIPVVAHESDATLGLANKLSVKHCTKICTTFKIDDGRGNGKFVHTGSPIRPTIYKGSKDVVAKRHNLTDKRNLLVMGGSLGAARINQSVLDAAQELTKVYNVIHVCGRGKVSPVENIKNYIQLEFVDDVENYIAWADVVVSRAGSNALCELAVLGKPSLFIPLSTGRGDQVHNVRQLEESSAALVLLEDNLSPCTLASSIETVWQNRELYSANFETLIKDGTKDIYNTIYSVVSHADDTK